MVSYMNGRNPARRIKTMTSGIDARSRPLPISPDLWAQGLGMGAESAIALEPAITEAEAAMAGDLQDARRTFSQGGMYRMPDGRITNVNLGGEQVMAEPTGMPERYASDGSFQTFSAGLGNQEASPLPGDIRPELLITKERPEDIDRQLKTLRGQEQDLLRQRYHRRYQGLGGGGMDEKLGEVRSKIRQLEQGRDLVKSQRSEQETLRNRIQDYVERGVGDREQLIADYNEAMARIGVPYEKRAELAKLEAEARPAHVPFGETAQGVQFEEQMKNFREQLKGEYKLQEKTLDKLDQGTLDADDYGKLWTAVSEKWDDPTKMIRDPETGDMRIPTAGEKQLLVAEEVNQILDAYNQRYGFGGPGLGAGGGGVQVQGKGVVNMNNLPELNPNDTASVQAYGNAIYAQNPWLTQDEVKARVAEDMKKASSKEKQVAGGIKQPEPKEEPEEAAPSPDEAGLMSPGLAGAQEEAPPRFSRRSPFATREAINPEEEERRARLAREQLGQDIAAIGGVVTAPLRSGAERVNRMTSNVDMGNPFTSAQESFENVREYAGRAGSFLGEIAEAGEMTRDSALRSALSMGVPQEKVQALDRALATRLGPRYFDQQTGMLNPEAIPILQEYARELGIPEEAIARMIQG